MALHVEVVSPESEVWSGEATLVVARTTEGDLGILPGHAPLLAVLAPGLVTVTPPDGQPVSTLVLGGFLSVADDRVSVLAESAEPADSLDVATAQQQLRDAEAADDEDAAVLARARLAAVETAR